MGAELIDPTRDRVWAVDVLITHTAYVVAKSADEAERIAKDTTDDFDPVYYARELVKPLVPHDPDADVKPYGASRWEDRELTVNEAVELVASHRPVYDTQTILMPF